MDTGNIFQNQQVPPDYDQYEERIAQVGQIQNDEETLYMGNHVVKTVRNLKKMR